MATSREGTHVARLRPPGALIRDGLTWLDQVRAYAPPGSAEPLARISRSAADLAAVLPSTDAETAAAESLAIAYAAITGWREIPASTRDRYSQHLEDALARLADRMELIVESLAVARSRRVEAIADQVRAMPAYEPRPAPALRPAPAPAAEPFGLVFVIAATVILALVFGVTRCSTTPDQPHAMPTATWSHS